MSVTFADLIVAGGVLIAVLAILWMMHRSKRPDPKWTMLQRLMQAAEPDPEFKD